MARVFIAGGGVIGLSIAWRAAQRGFEVTVADPAPGTGASWQLRALPPGNDPYPQATFYDASTGTVIPTGPQQSRRGVFYLTRDGGLTWRFTRQGGSVRPSGAISFVSPERGFGWNLNGQPPAIYTTANGGRSWTRFIPVS